jgi:hypothetical protein
MPHLLRRPLMKLANIAVGTADVHLLTDDPNMPGYVNREVLGSVYRLDTGQWVPVTRSRESHADLPVFPRFSTRQEAAQALASGLIVY